MKAEDFLQQDAFKAILAEAKKFENKQFSDIVDDENHQYVDLVQEGGGVLGIALIGYTAVLESIGIRFFNIAGTSAGAINTLLMACAGPISEAKSKKILESFISQNLFDFVDGNPKLKKIVQKAIDGVPFKNLIWELLFSLRKIKSALFINLGLNPGDVFKQWLETTIKGYNITSVKQLNQLRSSANFPKGLKHRTKGLIKDTEARLYILTADITTKSKIRFPEMAELYWDSKLLDSLNPAEFVRASMSIPFFFKPYEIKNIPHAGETNNQKWIDLTGYRGEVPKRASFVDGGMISNFPINLFHRIDNQTPRKPTFGVKLSEHRKSYTDIADLGDMIGAMISTMRHDADNDFLVSNKDFNQLICFIDADKDFKWLNFKMPPDRQKKLFLLGATKALEFLKQFDWNSYKNSR